MTVASYVFLFYFFLGGGCMEKSRNVQSSAVKIALTVI